MQYINASESIQNLEHIQTQANTQKDRERERERREWPLEQLTWCFCVSLKEAYQCTIWRLSGGHIIATVAVHYITWKMVPLPLVPIKGIFHCPRNSHGPSVPCPSQLPNPLFTPLFSSELLSNRNRESPWPALTTCRLDYYVVENYKSCGRKLL